MTSRHIRVLVPPPVAVPRAAVWLGQVLDWMQASRTTPPAAARQSATAAQQYATEGGK